MLQAGVHFGHQASRWHPKMAPFIYTQRNGVHIINLEKTQEELAKTLSAVKQMAKEGKVILFTSTKPQAQEIVKQAAIDCGMPYLVDRWIGGLLTNFSEIHRLLKKYRTLKEEQANGELGRYTKKEQLEFSKQIAVWDDTIGGIAVLEKIPDALFIPAMQREKTAVTEANQMEVSIIGICDTNANPAKAAYVIPANDDAVKSITLMVSLVAAAVKEGKAEAPVAPPKAAPSATGASPVREERAAVIAEG